MRAGLPALAAAALALAVAGCGSSKSASGTAAWADGLCSAVTTYTTALRSAGTSLKSGSVSRSDLQSTADDVNKATNTFVSDIKGLGKPETNAGAQAKQSVDALASDLQKDKDAIENATESTSISTVSEVLNAVSVVSGTLVTAGTQISDTWHQLQQLDAKDELTQAFSSVDSCKSLKET